MTAGRTRSLVFEYAALGPLRNNASSSYSFAEDLRQHLALAVSFSYMSGGCHNSMFHLVYDVAVLA